MRDLRSEESLRNFGFWNEPTQAAIYDTNYVIVGSGGAGYQTGIQLAHMGVQNFTILDPEAFERPNSNRVIGASELTYGRNKAEVFAEQVGAINKAAKVRPYIDGVTPHNVEDALKGSHVILDAAELTMPELGVMVAREARRIGTPVVSVEYVAHGAQVTSFHPKSKFTFERVRGIVGGETAALEDVALQRIPPDRFLAYLPGYADLRTLHAMNEGAPLPSNIIGASQAATLAVAESLKHIRQRVGERSIEPTWAPHVRWLDAYTGKSRLERHPRLAFYRNLVKAAVVNKLRLHEEASYTIGERRARGDVKSMRTASEDAPGLDARRTGENGRSVRGRSRPHDS